jgi:hypothetical protein
LRSSLCNNVSFRLDYLQRFFILIKVFLSLFSLLYLLLQLLMGIVGNNLTNFQLIFLNKFHLWYSLSLGLIDLLYFRLRKVLSRLRFFNWEIITLSVFYWWFDKAFVEIFVCLRFIEYAFLFLERILLALNKVELCAGDYFTGRLVLQEHLFCL